MNTSIKDVTLFQKLQSIKLSGNNKRDYIEIQNLISQQYETISWTEHLEVDWSLFNAGFYEGANLYPAKRPISPLTPQEFTKRMSELKKDKTLISFSETIIGIDINVFGNVANATVGCEMLENDTTPSYDISVMLLLKDNNKWRIVSQAWERATKPDCLKIGKK